MNFLNEVAKWPLKTVAKSMFVWLFFILISKNVFAENGEENAKLPIIDVHMHAFPLGMIHGVENMPSPVSGNLPPKDDGELFNRTVKAMDALGIKVGVVSGPLEAVEAWKNRAPSRFIGGTFFPFPGVRSPTVDEFQKSIESGLIGLLGEVTTAYSGMALSDKSMQGYLKTAAKAGVPVGIHTGIGIPGAPLHCCPEFRGEYATPRSLEKTLVQYKGLKVYLMHSGYPFIDDTLWLMHTFPDVYADLSEINYLLPKKEFHRYLKILVDAGFVDRLMFGSDIAFWPSDIKAGIDAIYDADFLSNQQKRLIFCENAERFFSIEGRVCKG